MNDYDNMEREINLIELFWSLLLKWRVLLGAMIMFGLLFGGVKYVKDNSGESNLTEKELSEDDMVQLEEGLPESEQKEIEDYAYYYGLIDQGRSYMSDSKLMKINPYAVWTGTVEYYVDTQYSFSFEGENHRDYTKEIKQAYSNYIESNSFITMLAENNNFNLDEHYLSELIATEDAASDQEHAILRIIIKHDDKEKLGNISKSVDQAIHQYTNKISEVIGAHKLVKLSEDLEEKIDLNLADSQKFQQEKLIDMQIKLTNLQQQLNEEQVQILTFRKILPGEEPLISNTKASPIGISKKYVLLGALAGLFFACAGIFLSLLFTKRLQSTKEITRIYGLHLLGEVSLINDKKKLFYLIDRQILKWKNRKKKILSYEQQLQRICINLELACRQAKINHIYISGSEMDKIDHKIIQNMKDQMSKAGVEIHWGMNINYDVNSLRQLVDIGNVVFMEQAHLSLYEGIRDEVSLAEKQRINILGVIGICS